MNTRYLKQENGTIAFDDQGKGSLVICVPSLGDVRGEYRFLIPQLVSAGYRAVSMDVRGMGESSVAWEDYSVVGVGKDILALIQDLDAGPAVIVGTSMAAGATIWAAAERPELIRGMILVGPFVRGEGNRFLEVMFSLMLMRPWGPSMWAKYYSSLYPTCKPADFAQYNAALLENLKQPGRVESLVKMLKTHKKASEERISSIRQPSLVLMGSKDPDFKRPESEAQWISEHLKSQYMMIEKAGHYPHAEMPEVAGPMMLRFIQSLPG
jgi:pimeloyl-ACP methyl ester carboxylesterase